MNTDLCKQALAKVGNANVLVNIVSRRVRQLTSSGGPSSRPLIADTAGMGAADIALTEIIEEKLGWEMTQKMEDEERDTAKKKKKKS